MDSSASSDNMDSSASLDQFWLHCSIKGYRGASPSIAGRPEVMGGRRGEKKKEQERQEEQEW